jgi:hypothetical protein
MPLYSRHYTANFRDPRPHLDSLTADTHNCGTNSLESVVNEFESSEDYREIWESPAVPSSGVRCEVYDYSDGSNEEGVEDRLSSL